MSHFDKFMKKIAEQEEARKKRMEELSRDDAAHNIRDRVNRYRELWQNRIVWRAPGSDKK